LRSKRLEFQLSGSINNILVVAVETGCYLDQFGWPYCFIGGVAYQRWGEPRQTVDVDGVLFAGFGEEQKFAESLTTDFKSRIEDPVQFAIQNRIVLLESSSGVGIDLSLGGLPYEERMIARASAWDVPSHGKIKTCSADDLVVLKTVAARPQDWIDIEKVIIRQGSKLNRNLINEELQPLLALKEEPELKDQLDQIFDQHNT
jgi:hypothetical protein